MALILIHWFILLESMTDNRGLERTQKINLLFVKTVGQKVNLSEILRIFYQKCKVHSFNIVSIDTLQAQLRVFFYA